MRGRHKAWAAPYLAAHPEFVFAQIDPHDPFFFAPALGLEIGMGKGDFLLGMASKNPNVHYLGLERDVSICGTAGKKLEAANLANLRIAGLDFDAAFETLQGLKFDMIYLNFSDPWPKKRHWKRRLTTKERLLKMASLLKEDGEIRFKSDNLPLYEYTLEQAPLAGLNVVTSTDHYQLAEDDVLTEYEKQFREQGKPITRIVLKKKV